LKKVITTPPTYTYGQVVSFDKTIYNQGNMDAHNVELIDYLPCGYAFAPTNTAWTYDATNHTATQVVADLTPIAPGDSLVVTIELIIQPCAEEFAFTNTGEIAGAEDENGNPMEDIDSDPDNDNFND